MKMPDEDIQRDAQPLNKERRLSLTLPSASESEQQPKARNYSTKRLTIAAGDRYNRWTIVCEVAKGKQGRTFLAKCDCGNQKEVPLEYLRRNEVKSCGCLAKEVVHIPPVMIIHGASGGKSGPRWPEYSIWLAMKDRCLNPRHRFYEYYGGRGITVCMEWRVSFVAFIEHVGRRPHPKLQIDRKNNNGNYEPGNVHWATKDQQMANRRPYKPRIKKAS